MSKEETFVPALLCAFVCAGTLACGRQEDAAFSRAPLPAPSSPVRPQVREALETKEAVDVIVNFRDPAPETLARDQAAHRLHLRQMREGILARVPAGFVPHRQFDHVPAVAGSMSRAALDALANDPNVESIQLDGRGSGALLQAVPAIHGDVAKQANRVTGKGVRVAVIDTGVSSTHPDLKASLVGTQHCFTRNACPPNNASEGTSAEDDNGHGSHVAGVVTADGIMNKVGPGFAPDAEIVAVKVDDRSDAGFISDWVAGLDWVASNLGTLKVKVVNLSICSDDRYATAGECDAQQPAMAKAVKNLIDAGVTLFAASGNMGDKAKLASPACNTGVIAVGATYKMDQGRQPDTGASYSQWSGFGDCWDATTAFDQVACFTNSGPRLDLVAPGAIIVSAYMGSTQYGIYRGTSQASPAAAGVAALMLQCNPDLKPADVKDLLIRTAVTVNDAKNGLSFPSLRADLAVAAACAATNADGGVDATRGGTDAADLAPGTGGVAGTGGVTGAGGSGATGGATTAEGGSSGRGGQVGSGGTTSATGGKPGSGGQPGSGGASPVTGGDSGKGGTGAGGVASATGGSDRNSGAGGSGATGGVSGQGSGTRPATGSSGCACAVGAASAGSPVASSIVGLLLALVLGRARRRRHARAAARISSGDMGWSSAVRAVCR